MFGVWMAGALSIIATAVAARALGPTDYGSVFLAMSIVASIAIFLDFTFEEAAVFHGNRAVAAGDHAGLRSLLWLTLRIDVAIGLIVTATIVALADPIADVASGGSLDPDLVRIVALSVLVTTADSTAYAALALVRRPDLRARAFAATSAFRLIGVCIAVALGGVEAVAVSYVVGGALGSLVLGRLAWRHAWRSWDSGTALSERPVRARELIRFGFHTSATTSVRAITGTLVPVLLARAAGPAAVGIFRVGMLPILVSQSLSSPIRLAIFPEQARLVATGQGRELRKAARGYTQIAVGLGLFGSVAAWFLLPWLIPLIYSSDYEAAVTPARIMLVAAVIQIALGWRKSMLAAIGRPEINTRLAILNVVVVVPLMVVLGDRGAEGAAIAVTAGVVATGLAWLIIAPRVLRDEALLLARRDRTRVEQKPARNRPAAPPQQDPSVARR